ncbi:pilus biogenesis protein [Dissulfurispira thermophila]|uniref:Pilus biogenesis protein n=1 Tax=Dissulfurispira thermophila TaxID=2715679 RepID=A0A7G1H3A6_9BACT|nr:PIN domain-containing protein [Dissulfurispira thermophila]BCB97290.1 pilus biogenesis protein [Dissulfurispira thermophila]
MILIDTGPLVAVFDKKDKSHAICLEIVKNIKTPFITTMPVVTETFYLLRYSWHTQNKLWETIEEGLLRIYSIDANMLRRCRELMNKYQDLPMDFADASLVAVADKENISKIFTLDHKDFKTYRTKSGKSFRLLPSIL